MNRLITRMPTAHAMISSVLILLASLFYLGSLHAAPLDISNIPLDVKEGVPPNILLTFDNSGSMNWSYLPDSLHSLDATGAFDAEASSSYNALYYNPNIRYVPGVDDNGNSLGNASFTAAWDDGYTQGASGSCTINLSSAYQATWRDGDNCDGTTSSEEYQTNAPTSANGAAYYYNYNPPSGSTASCQSDPTQDICYTAVILDSSFTSFTAPAGRTDCGSTCTLAEEQQNFANWYSYYRKRVLLAKNAAGRAFASITGTVRVSHQAINDDPSTTTDDRIIGDFKSFTGTPRSDFFTWLYGLTPPNQSTPLPAAYVRAGKVFTTSGIDSPYATDPGVTDAGVTGEEYSCRQNFNVNFTDGYWNSGVTGYGNDDGTNQSIPSTNNYGVTSYTQEHPYSDKNSNYLADIAFYYWRNDLRSDLTDNVPDYISNSTTTMLGASNPSNADIFWNPVNDPAKWQHMVTFNIGLGVDGALAYNDTTLTALENGTDKWGSDHIDDLWHAALNGRGQYFSAKNPTDLVNAFSGVLNAIGARQGSSSAPAPSAPNYQAGNYIYQPIYDTSDWSGNLKQYDLSDLTTPVNTAAAVMKTNNSNGANRTIISYDPYSGNGTGIKFDSTAMSAKLLATLGTSVPADDVINYVSGNQDQEQSNGGPYRNRNNILGDIVDSAPVYVGPPDRRFPDSLESAPYSSFITTYASRPNMIWVGANDGMLHGFDADSLKEILAFVPSSIYPDLADLTDTSYTHHFYVDGSPTERDAFFANAWHTVLVGGLNAGGRGIYALDITNPANFTSSNASKLVLWEFNALNDPDLGYTYSQPQVAKMNNGDWMAIFGNGYNNTEDTNGWCNDNDTSTPCLASSTGDAVLYMLDMDKGPNATSSPCGTAGINWCKFDTLVGKAQDPTGQNRPNGLSSVALVDADGNFTVDYIYAGDLFGNLWKFDVSSSDPTKWTIVKASDGITPTPLFVATDASGNRQPITTAPVVGAHTSEPGFMINFGTGKYLESNDSTDHSVQSFYGIWDRNTSSTITSIQRADTLAQSIIYTNTTQFGSTYGRLVSNNTVNWYLGSQDLPTTPSTDGYLGWHLDLVDENGTQLGERLSATPQRIGDHIIFVTNVPSPDPCLAGGSSWIMELDAVTGQPTSSSVFDYNGDGMVSPNDLVSDAALPSNGQIDPSTLYVGSGIQQANAGKLSRPTIMRNGSQELKISSTSTGGFVKITEAPPSGTGRRSWIPLDPN